MAFVVYTVKRHDTMVKIAAAHGVTVGALVRSNPHIEKPSLIFPGQRLRIPGAHGPSDTEFSEVYRVRSDDTMSTIALMKGVSLADLIAANPQVTNPHLIRVGELINVPATDPDSDIGDITPPHGGGTPKWYRLARREMRDGIVEYGEPGEHNPRILDYHATVTGGFLENEVPWCSSFVNWCVEQAGFPGTNSAVARSWERWGRKLSTPKPGAIAVFWRESKSSGLGHVGFYAGQTSVNVAVLGGNQGNRVSVDDYPKVRLLGYRWPDD